MIVVADKTPLNYLIRLGYISVLNTIYGRVIAPEAVLQEMMHPDAPPEVRAWALSPPVWFEKVSVRQLDASLPSKLGMGEREAISLALEIKADLLLIDERAGRHEAEVRHIEAAGTLAVLLEASLTGQLHENLEFSERLDNLKRLGFRVSPSVMAMMIARLEEARGPKL